MDSLRITVSLGGDSIRAQLHLDDTSVTSIGLFARIRRSPLPLVAAVSIAVRVLIGAALWNPVYSALTWDDFTRVSIAWNWSHNPFVSADIVWLPAQTWVLGTLFWLTGDAFAGNPMALAAITNTVLIIATALVVGLAARRLSNSKAGGLLAFLIVLYSPWGFYTANAGLAEPLYYLASSMAFLGVIGFDRIRSRKAIWIGVLGVSLAAATRYEGWWLAVAWAGAIAWSQLRHERPRTLTAAVSKLWPIGVPFVVPAGWMAYNFATTGSPTTFVARSAEYFSSAYGGPPTVIGRLLYYPASLVRADLLLLVVTAAVGWAMRRNPTVRLLFGTVTIHGTLFVGTSLLGSAVGAFNERFMFSFILAVVPVLGFVPHLAALRGRAWRRSSRRVAVTLAVAALAGITAFRVTDRPIEWSHAPDLLALADGVAALAVDGTPITLSIDPRMAPIAATPLSVAAGNRIAVTIDDAPPPGSHLRVVPLPGDPEAGDSPPEDSPVRFGRFVVTGPISGRLDGLDDAPCLCTGWIRIDENGESHRQGEPSLAWNQFDAADPPAGSVARLVTRLEPDLGRAEFEVRSLYGHGFNPGRITVSVLVDGERVADWDLSEPSHWKRLTITSAPGGSTLEVRLEAMPGIESGWAWGTASTVLVRDLEDVPG